MGKDLKLNSMNFFFFCSSNDQKTNQGKSFLQNYKATIFSQKWQFYIKSRENETCNIFLFQQNEQIFFFTCKTKFNYVLDLSRAQEASVLQEKSLSISSPRSESNFPKQLMGLQAEMKALALLHELGSLSLSESSKCGAN